MAFYNPRSQVPPASIRRSAGDSARGMRPGPADHLRPRRQHTRRGLRTVTLGEATPEMADMRTVVLVGNSATRRVGRYVYTPRGGIDEPSHRHILCRPPAHAGRPAGRHDHGRPSARAASSLARAPLPPAFLATTWVIAMVAHQRVSPATSKGPRASTTVARGSGSGARRIHQPQQIPVLRLGAKSARSAACRWPETRAPARRAGRRADPSMSARRSSRHRPAPATAGAPTGSAAVRSGAGA